MKSSRSDGPRTPALSEFWLSLIRVPWLVVSISSAPLSRKGSRASSFSFVTLPFVTLSSVTLSRFVRLALRFVATGNPPENIERSGDGSPERKGRAVVATPPERFGNAAIARKSFALTRIAVRQEYRVRGSGPPYLWTYRVSLTGVTVIL